MIMMKTRCNVSFSLGIEFLLFAACCSYHSGVCGLCDDPCPWLISSVMR